MERLVNDPDADADQWPHLHGQRHDENAGHPDADPDADESAPGANIADADEPDDDEEPTEMRTGVITDEFPGEAERVIDVHLPGDHPSDDAPLADNATGGDAELDEEFDDGEADDWPPTDDLPQGEDQTFGGDLGEDDQDLDEDADARKALGEVS